MKKRNIAAAILLASMMAVSTCAVTSMTAVADTITITPGVADSTNHNYKAYQIIKGDAHDDTISNITGWGDNMPTDRSGLLTDLGANDVFKVSGTNVFSTLTTASTPSEFATALSKLTTNEQNQEFARVIGLYVTGSPKASDDTVSEGKYELTGLASGYYIVKDDATLGEGEGRTLNLLKVAGTVSITAKENAPTSDKKVDDVNDSTGTSEALQTDADYDIGDTIPYTLTFTLPSDYDKYTQYPITFIDDMYKGLTYNNDAVIYYNTDTSAAGTSIHDSSGTSYFSASGDTSSYGTGNGTVYKCTIANLKTYIPTYSAGAVVTIKYTATLNSNARVGSAGNPNTYKVQYANDPNWTPNVTTPGEPPTGETPPSENKVYTYQVVINKVKYQAGSSTVTEPLTGADFTLYKFIQGTATTDNETYKVGSTTYTGHWADVTTLGDGTNKPTKTTSDSGSVTACVFTFSGLDDGHYKLSETTPPNGYNAIPDKIFDISAATNGTLDATTDFSVDSTAGSLSADIINQPGTTLPSTGGIGTTIFYVVGGTLVAGAVVLLITKKRMSINDQK